MVSHSKTAARLVVAVGKILTLLKEADKDPSFTEESREAWLLSLGSLSQQLELIMAIESREELAQEAIKTLDGLRADANEMLDQLDGQLAVVI